MSTLFPVLHAKNMLSLESCGVDIGRPLARRYCHNTCVTALDSTPDGLWITSGCHDGTIILWSMVDHDLSPVLDWGAHPEAIAQLQFSPDGQHLASSSKFHIRIWDAIHGIQLAILFAGKHISDTPSDPDSFQQYGVVSMVWSPMGTIIAYDPQGIVQWWDTNTFDSASDQPSLVGGIQSLKDTTPSAVISSHGKCCLTRRGLAETNKQPAHLTGTHPWLFDSAFSSDGSRLITVYGDGSVMIWDVSELENIPPSCELSLPSDQKQPGSMIDLVEIGTSGIGREVLVRRLRDNIVEMWDTHTSSQMASLEHDHEVSTAHISRCGKVVVTSTYLSMEYMVYLWRVSDGTCLESFKLKEEGCGGLKLVFVPDGQTLVYGSGGTVFCHPIGHLRI